MAIVLLDKIDGGASDYPDHKVYYHMGRVEYDSITREGNRITVWGFRVYGPFTYTIGFGGDFGWKSVWKHYVGLWDWDNRFEAGTQRLSSGNIFTTVNPSKWSCCSGTLWGDSNTTAISVNFTFSAGPDETSKKFAIAVAKESETGINDMKVYDEDGYGSFTLTFPKDTRRFQASAENATFDLKRNSDTVGDNISSYDAYWTYNNTWTISDIKANSGYYLTSTTNETSGTLTEDKYISVASTMKCISMNVTATGATFDLIYNGSKVADDKSSYSNNEIQQGKNYYIEDLKLASGYNMWDYKNPASGTTSNTDISILAATASKVSLSSSITYTTPLKVKSKATLSITDNSGRNRNWQFTAKLKKGSTVLETISQTTGTGKTATVEFDRYSLGKTLKTDTSYTVEWTITDLTDIYAQSYSNSKSFTLPSLGRIVDSATNKKVSYFTITEALDQGGAVKYSYKRVTNT